MRRIALPLALALLGAGVVTASASDARPVKLYLHSAGGSYVDDWNADRTAATESRAPNGSALSAQKPGGRIDATARYAGPAALAGTPGTPSFALPYSGRLDAVCVDVWTRAEVRPDPAAQALGLTVTVQTPGAPDKSVRYAGGSVTRAPYDGSLVRLTGLVHLGVSVPHGSALLLAPADPAANPDWVVTYDSAVHASSVTLNPLRCGTPPPPLPRPNCFTVRDGRGDANLVVKSVSKPEPSLDVTGVTVGLTPSHVMAYVKVAALAARPAYAPGYVWQLSFRVNGETLTATGTHYDPDAAGFPQDTATALGAPVVARTRLEDDGKPVSSALTVTYDLARSTVVFALPIADVTAAAGGLTYGRRFTDVVARSAEAYGPAVDPTPVDATPSGRWAVGDNRCF
jgi:hypothetical protein